MPEMNIAPAEFQARLTELGGLNRYDSPNFVLWWGQYAHGDGSFIAGGVWSVDEQYYKGYRSLLRGSGEPCWCLGQWHAPEEYGAPESYYLTNYDEDTGLQILGEYPYSGRVEVLYNLRWHEMVDGKLELRTMPLTTRTFDDIIPIILAAKEVSLERQKAAILDARARDEAAKTAEIERHLMDKALPFAGQSISYTRQGIRSTAVDAKMKLLQAKWNDLASSARQFKKGIQVR